MLDEDQNISKLQMILACQSLIKVLQVRLPDLPNLYDEIMSVITMEREIIKLYS